MPAQPISHQPEHECWIQVLFRPARTFLLSRWRCGLPDLPGWLSLALLVACPVSSADAGSPQAGLLNFGFIFIFGSFHEIMVCETPEFKGDVALFCRTTPC